MDDSIVLSQIYDNQLLIINLLSRIDEGIMVIVFILSIIFLYIFIRNMTKG